MTLFECKNLSLGYDGKSVAENINFSVSKGDYLCIIGQNGSGKSTLIKTLLGLQKPVSGSIEGNILPSQIGYMPQTTELQQDFPATVKEIVLSGLLGSKGFFGFYTKKDLAKARENMKKLGISDLESKRFRDLSGGQRQRVLLARALCAAKDVLLLDEPCAGLDAHTTHELYDLIKKLNDSGVAIIMVTHDMDSAEVYAKQILCLGCGLFFGTRDEYIKHTGKGGND